MNYPRPETVSSKTEDPSSPEIGLPKISVVVTCFNYARYVGQALDSVACQTYKNFECVIIDDASTDNSGPLVQRWIDERNDIRFRLIRNSSNCGQTGSLAAGLAATSGPFVALLDADDFWFPEFIQRHLEAHLNRSFVASVSCSDLVQVTTDGAALSGTGGGPNIAIGNTQNISIIDAHHTARIERDGYLEYQQTPNIKYISPGYLDFPWTVTSGMMFRRAALDLIMPNTQANSAFVPMVMPSSSVTFSPDL